MRIAGPASCKPAMSCVCDTPTQDSANTREGRDQSSWRVGSCLGPAVNCPGPGSCDAEVMSHSAVLMPGLSGAGRHPGACHACLQLLGGRASLWQGCLWAPLPPVNHASGARLCSVCHEHACASVASEAQSVQSGHCTASCQDVPAVEMQPSQGMKEIMSMGFRQHGATKLVHN